MCEGLLWARFQAAPPNPTKTGKAKAKTGNDSESKVSEHVAATDIPAVTAPAKHLSAGSFSAHAATAVETAGTVKYKIVAAMPTMPKVTAAFKYWLSRK